MRSALATVSLLALLPIAGCHAPSRAPAGMSGDTAVLVDGTQPRSLAELFHPAGAREKTYLVRDEVGGEVTARERRVITEADADGVWLVRTAPVDAGGEAVGPERTTALTRNETGDVLMLWVVTPDDSKPESGIVRRFAFEPPMVMMPADVSPADRFEYESTMIEQDPETRQPKVLTGKATRAVYLLDPGERSRLVPAGIDGPAVVSTMDVRFGPVVDRRWVVSVADPAGEAGIIAEYEEKSRTFFGIGGDAEVRVFELR